MKGWGRGLPACCHLRAGTGRGRNPAAQRVGAGRCPSSGDKDLIEAEAVAVPLAPRPRCPHTARCGTSLVSGTAGDTCVPLASEVLYVCPLVLQGDPGRASATL